MGENILEKVKQLEELFGKYEITGRELAQVRALAEKMEKQEMTVSVIGQFKRGKSTLVNGILGDEVMPVGIVPVTAVVTTVKYDEQKAAKVHFENGAVISCGFEDISGYINEQENEDNHLGVSRVELTVPAHFLKSGITLVDTPGVGSVHQKNSDAAYAFVKESDAVIFLLSVDSPINQIEIDFLKKTRQFASKFYFAVNKADIVDEEDLQAYLSYCRRLIAKLMEVDEIQLFAVSARKQTGLTELEEAVEQDCRQKAADIIQASVRLKLRDIVKSALNQITLYRTALNMTGEEFEEKFGKMNQAFAEIQEEAAQFGREFAGNGPLLQAQLNQFRNRLADKVQELFGMEYHYDLPEVELDGSDADAAFGGSAGSRGSTKSAIFSGNDLDQAVFLHQTERLCKDLSQTLNVIFMYREENAYTVVRRINDLNRLVRSLARMRSQLAEETEEAAMKEDA